MKKFKYQGYLTNFISKRIGEFNKNKFALFIHINLLKIRGNLVQKPIPLSVVSFSSNKDFYDQILSILSFLRYVGTPTKWTLYSDGSHSNQQIELLKRYFEFIEIVKDDWGNLSSIFIQKNELVPFKNELLNYAKHMPLGKKLFYYLNHKIIDSTLFIDSDILFYSKASVLNLIIQDKIHGYFLTDPDWGCLDSRYKEKNQKQQYQANSGFFLVNQEIEDLKEGLEFLKSLDYKYEYFSEQNIFHILFRSNDFVPLDSSIFIINSGDQFDFSYLYNKENIAIRHYTGPVRHKMWQRDWKWQLSI